MRIAYVDDNLVNLALMQRIATMNNHSITSYTEGEVALVELSRQTFDLILMDVELAGEMGGLQVVRALRARGLTTPMIAVTAYAMIGDRERCIEAGCNDYLSKPLSIPETLALLNRYEAILKGAPAATPTVAAAPVPPSTDGVSRRATGPLPVQSAVEKPAAPASSVTAQPPAEMKPETQASPAVKEASSAEAKPPPTPEKIETKDVAPGSASDTASVKPEIKDEKATVKPTEGDDNKPILAAAPTATTPAVPPTVTVSSPVSANGTATAKPSDPPVVNR